jgi:hypothetical protein
MGMSGIGTDFYPLVQSLAKRRRVIILDNRGLGKSKFPVDEDGEPDLSELSLERMGLDALAVARELGFKTIDLLGWSECASSLLPWRHTDKYLRSGMGGHITQVIITHESAKPTSDGYTEVQGVKIRNVVLTATMTKLPHGDFQPDEMAQA